MIMARRKKTQSISWLIVGIATREGRKVTQATIDERDQCPDGSQFFFCPDHPQGGRWLRFWPHGVR